MARWPGRAGAVCRPCSCSSSAQLSSDDNDVLDVTSPQHVGVRAYASTAAAAAAVDFKPQATVREAAVSPTNTA